jgi:glutamyl-tRNA reductase
MNLKVIGLDHKIATVEEREAALRDLNGLPGVLLSTCNRVELYQLADNAASEIAVRHLFRVAAGLDSQILGETEILGQVRKAAVNAEGFLGQLFKTAVAVGKRVREETDISRGNVSIASVAVTIARRLLDKGPKKKVLLVGSGKIAEAVLKNLLKSNYEFVFVANRTFDKAEQLSEKIGGTAVRFDRLVDEIEKADLVMCSTSAPHLVLKSDRIKKRKKPLLVIDLAMPRDVDPAVAAIAGVKLLNLDDIKEEINLNLLRRRIEAVRAEQIVEQEVKLFCEKYVSEAVPAA